MLQRKAATRLEGPVLQPPVDEVGGGNGFSRGPCLRTDGADGHQAFGFRIRQRPQQLGIDDGEGRDRRADAGRERQDRRGRE